MAISRNVPNNLGDAAKLAFRDKVLNKLPTDARQALIDLVCAESTVINWESAYAIFAMYFPELLSESNRMSKDNLIAALNTFEQGEYSVFEEWIENGLINDIELDDYENYTFDDVVAILSKFLYDYEYCDMQEDCDELAVYIARQIFE